MNDFLNKSAPYSNLGFNYSLLNLCNQLLNSNQQPQQQQPQQEPQHHQQQLHNRFNQPTPQQQVQQQKPQQQLQQQQQPQQQYEQMLVDQNNECAICKNKIGWEAAVDHCHNTNKIRGLLCRKCNLGLGGFKDDIEIIKKAIKYVKENM